MIDVSNYYEKDPFYKESIQSDRFPGNHVRFPLFLRPLEWIDKIYGRLGTRTFLLKNDMLKEFDSAAPLDDYLGTKEERDQLRSKIELFGQGIDENPYISSIGRFALKKYILDLLKNRKKVLKYYHNNKDFIDANGKFKAPVIITGLPRSGTTLLYRIMSEDPNTRSPYTFEMDVPIPPMTINANALEDSRIKKSNTYKFAKAQSDFFEKFAESHLLSPTEKEESFPHMLFHNGINIMNAATAGYKYIKTFEKLKGIRSVFRYERIFFTMLNAYRPVRSHWTLKAPTYAPYFPMIFEEYPDARVITTHRNPMVTLPSVCRLLESWCIPSDKDGAFDKHRFGKFCMALFRAFVIAPLDFRKDHPVKEEQIFDCMYKELFSDPISMVKKIYKKFNLEYTDEFEKRMKTYLENNRQGKFGRHKYSLDEYGLSRQDIYQEYKDYLEHYDFDVSEKIRRPKSFDFSIA